MNRAFAYLKENLAQKVLLRDVAVESGASQYHFIRIFNAYTGETPFSFLRRERIVQSLILLNETSNPIIDIALSNGFDTSSSFNKAFKKVTNLNPTEFRNMGKDQKKKIIYDLSMTPKAKEIIMNFNMNLTPEIITRKETVVYTSAAKGGDFKDIAPLAWENFMKVLPNIKENLEQSEYFGIGTMVAEDTKKVCNYKAALSIPTNLDFEIEGLTKEVLPKSKYAKFLLKGSYDNVWIAFDKAFQIISESEHGISEAPCIEKYLNDPTQTPVDELLTEILIPIK
jgi:AraC family transcriptional regulator